MKTVLASTLRVAALAATLLSARVAAAADQSADPAARALAQTGAIAVQNAGPYVEVGTFRIQVATKLGQPTAKLTNDTWLYPARHVAGSAAEGTLIVRFAGGRVVSLTLAAPAVVAALQENARRGAAPDLVAKK